MRHEANGFGQGFGHLRIGDVVPSAPGGAAADAIWAGGAPRWHALRVMPQREDQAEAWLAARGVRAFHPVTVHRTRQRGVLRAYRRRYLPGLVFALFPGAAVMNRVRACPYVTGALVLASGEWAVLDPSDLRGLRAMAAVDAATEAARRADRARARRATLVRAGDRALFRAGPLAGQPCEVVALDASGGARVRLGLFGGDQVAMARADDLVPVRRVA